MTSIKVSEVTPPGASPPLHLPATPAGAPMRPATASPFGSAPEISLVGGLEPDGASTAITKEREVGGRNGAVLARNWEGRNWGKVGSCCRSQPVIVAIPYHATWGLTPAVFRMVPVRLKWLYWAIFDPAFLQCLHCQYRWHIRILEQQYAASTVLTLFNDMSRSRLPPPSQLQLGASPHLLRQVTWPP